MSQQDNPYRAPDMATMPAETLTETLISRGRFVFFAIVAFFIVFDIIMQLAVDNDLKTMRLVMLGCLLLAMWRGYGWTRVVLGLVVAMAVPYLIIYTVGMFKTAHPLFISLNLVLLGSQILVLFALFFSKSLKAYCTRKANTDAAETTLVKATLPSLPEDPTGKELFTVATFDHRAMADVCRIAIEQEGIKVFIADDHLIGGANLFLSNAVLGIKVQVSDLDARRAVEIWHQNEAAAEINKPDLYTPVDFNCEECGKAVSFPGHRKGHVETCPHCGEYVDVPE